MTVSYINTFISGSIRQKSSNNQQLPPQQPSDPFFNNVSFLIGNPGTPDIGSWSVQPPYTQNVSAAGGYGNIPAGITSAYTFDGTNSYGKISRETCASSLTSPFTVEFWSVFGFNGESGFMNFSHGNASLSAGTWDLRLTGDSLKLYINSSTTPKVSTSLAYVHDGSFHHYALSSDGTSYTKFFVDGENIMTTTTPLSFSQAGTPFLWIGTPSTQTYATGVKMAEIRITRTARYSSTFTGPTGMYPRQ